MADKFLNYIGGKWVAARSGRVFPNLNPANGEKLGEFPDSDAADVADAALAARAAFDGWRLTPAPKRAEILYRLGGLIAARKEELSKGATREMGKILLETRGDVQEGIDMAYLAAGEGRRLYGVTTPSEMPNKWAMSVRVPVGRGRHHHRLELPVRGANLEDLSGAGGGQHRGIQAFGGIARDRLPAGATARRGRAARRV